MTAHCHKSAVVVCSISRSFADQFQVQQHATSDICPAPLTVQWNTSLRHYRAQIISWQFCVNIFWNAIHLAQKVDHQSWIEEVQHLPFKAKI